MSEWLFKERKKQVAERSVQRAAARVLDDMRREAVSNIRSGARKADEPSVILDLAKWIAEILKRMRPSLREAVIQGVLTAMEGLGLDGTAVAERVVVEKILDAVNRKMKRVPESVIEEINEAMAEGLELEEDSTELAKRVDKQLKKSNPVRSKMIARTSGTAAFEGGQLEAFRDVGLSQKGWLAQPGARPSHAEAHLQRVPIEEPFSVGESKLMHPGDPTGPADEVINCRCSLQGIP